MHGDAIEADAADLVQRLSQLKLSLAAAESCTGGWIAKLLTDIPGSSACFERGFVTYSNAAKQEMLGVAADLIERHGAVSQQTVAAMAEGALRFSRADLALSVSGIAGPSGGTMEKPVGTVWLGWCRRGEAVRTRLAHFEGDRDAVRRRAAHAAILGVQDLL